jgi:hypothetical protein
MNNAIVGIRYVGKKDRQEDTVCKSGAVWLPGQVHNFSAAMAKSLLVHTDSFALAPISMDGGTFLTQGKGKLNKQHDVAVFANINGMGIDQMIVFARTELNRVVNVADKDEAQIRREVLSLMTNHSLDQEAERRKTEKTEDGRTPITYMATAEEFSAYQSGVVRLAIVPTEVVMATAEQPADEQTDPPVPLGALLDGLEKKELMEFAKQEGVGFSNNFSADKLRERILEELTARAEQKAA